MQQYTAANFALAWRCKITPTPNPSVWCAWRGDSDRPAAVLWIDETALDLEQANVNARAALSSRAGESGVIVVMAISATRAQWSSGGPVRELAMPVQPRHERVSRWYCETCKGRHPLARMAACRAGERV